MTNTTSSPYLKVENLVKNFGNFTALNDISLEIFESEFICFLGPSGCGKTTLLRAIAGLDIQTAGTIEQAGKEISTLPPSERDFGIVFQSYALFPNLTVQRNVAYGLENKGKAKRDIDAKVKELLELVGLSDQGDKYSAQLSGGQQQRVALARALATSPGLLLLDEPLSALDAKVRSHLRHEIKALQHKIGITTIMVTHDQEEALTMADRIVVMNHGSIEQIDRPNEIYDHPASPFVADFIGTMNFLDGQAAGNNHVVLGGVTMRVDGDQTSADSSEITVCIRPEDVATRGVDADSENAIEATVAELEFLGSVHRATLNIKGHDSLQFRADFSANLMRDHAISEGKSVHVAFPADRLHVFGDRVNMAESP
mgnify:CR=1 FL=1